MNQYNCKYESLRNIFSSNIVAQHISESLESLNIRVSLEKIKNYLSKKNYDVVGVEEDENVIGYILRDDINSNLNRPIGEIIRKFTTDNIVSANTSLKDILSFFKDREWIFLLNGKNKIEIITKADLQKMPIRILFFGMISIFEMNMLERIKKKHIVNWESSLSSKRLDKAKEIYGKRKSKNQEIDLLDCLQICDKMTILRKNDKELLKTFDISINKFKKSVESFQDLRDSIAHSQDLLAGISLDEIIEIYQELEEFNNKFKEIN